jgi:hypothetical protein
MTVNVDRQSDFYSLLAASTRAPEIPESADVYGWLCGSWDLEVLWPGRNFQSVGIIAGTRNADALTFSMRLTLQRLEIDRVEGFHPFGRMSSRRS